MKENKQPKKPATIAELFARRTALHQQIAILELEEDEITELLKTAIPPNETIENVKHQYTVGQTISYSEYIAYLLDKYVPTTKRFAASEDRAKFAKQRETHTIREAK